MKKVFILILALNVFFADYLFISNVNLKKQVTEQNDTIYELEHYSIPELENALEEYKSGIKECYYKLAID